MNESDSRTPSVVSFLFFFSGITSLIYEIVWSRILSTILGNTSLAVAIVVSIFMTGLAAGSFLAIRTRLGRGKPLLIYAILELIIGVYAIVTPQMAKLLDIFYAAAYPTVSNRFFASVLLKAALSAALLILPTIAMGATLPVLIRLYPATVRRSRAAFLYGLNTAGAVAGTLIAGYLLLPNLGIATTILLTACLNGTISAIAFIQNKTVVFESPAPQKAFGFRPIYLLFLVSGFASLSYEILWTRAMTMFFGSSVYAFSAILAAFLVGIAAGSSFYAKRIPEEADPFQFYSLVQFRLALAVMFFVGIFMGIPFLLIRLFQTFYFSFPLFQTAQFFLIGATIFYATFLSGATFPAALHFFRKMPEETQTHTALLYTYSTIGSILGAFAAGFLLIPLLGIERSIRIVVLINLILGMICFRRTQPAKQDKRVLLVGGASLALLLILPAWNRSIFNAGFYAFAYKYVPKNKSAGTETHPPKTAGYVAAGLLGTPKSTFDLNLLYYAEGLTATVAVAEDEKGIRSLLINGKPDASNVPTGDMRTQLLLGHLPVLLKGSVHDALVIGLGSGVTAGALETHHAARIDCVEIEKKVAIAAQYFQAENLTILTQPNFHLIFDDGRNYVQHSLRQYDVITSEPSNLWMSGVANLFTREFFQSAKNRLRSDGMLCQWIHLYQISPQDIFIFLKTFHSVFPHLTIWIDDSDMLLIGANYPIKIDPALIAKRMEDPEVQQSVMRSNLTPENLLKKYVGDERLVLLLRESLPLNTDDHPVLEFSAPRSLFWNRSREIAQSLYLMKRISDQTNFNQQ